jgi:hypothetical protein
MTMTIQYKVVDTFNGGTFHDGPLSYEEAEDILDEARTAFFKPLGNRNSRFMGGIVRTNTTWYFDQHANQFIWG